MGETLDFHQIERYLNNERTEADIIKDDITRLGWCIDNMNIAYEHNVNTALGIGSGITMDMTFVFACELDGTEYEFHADDIKDAHRLLASLRERLEQIENL